MLFQVSALVVIIAEYAVGFEAFALLLAPADACAPVRRGADLVLSRRGGHGAVRELAERILQARDGWRSLSRRGWRDRND